ncbi:MAG: helix-hairpin-helix domain-containing protein [Anaeromyxobacteraceae bacterium]
MPRRLATLALLAAAVLPSLLRARAERPAAPRRCAAVGRGVTPRGWVGCPADEGPPRVLAGRERLLFGLPIDLNTAAADDLASVPGLTPRVAAEIVAERARGGAYREVSELLRVRGVGPARLERARPHLACER